jgi:hypothetical protein
MTMHANTGESTLKPHPDNLLNAEQLLYIQLIMDGDIRTYSDWFIAKFCTTTYISPDGKRPEGVSERAKNESCHIHLDGSLGGTHFYLTKKIDVRTVHDSFYQFMSAVKFLEENDCIIVHPSSFITKIGKGSLLANDDGAFGDYNTGIAVQYVLRLMHDGNDHRTKLAHQEIVPLPEINALSDRGFLTRSQVQAQQVDRAHKQADKATNWSVAIAIIAVLSSLATVFVQSCGTSDVKVIDATPRVVSAPVIYQPPTSP